MKSCKKYEQPGYPLPEVPFGLPPQIGESVLFYPERGHHKGPIRRHQTQ